MLCGFFVFVFFLIWNFLFGHCLFPVFGEMTRTVVFRERQMHSRASCFPPESACLASCMAASWAPHLFHLCTDLPWGTLRAWASFRGLWTLNTTVELHVVFMGYECVYGIKHCRDLIKTFSSIDSEIFRLMSNITLKGIWSHLCSMSNILEQWEAKGFLHWAEATGVMQLFKKMLIRHSDIGSNVKCLERAF